MNYLLPTIREYQASLLQLSYGLIAPFRQQLPGKLVF